MSTSGPAGQFDDAENEPQPLGLSAGIAAPITSYYRTLRFQAPELMKRYFRLFGDLEYDLLSLKAEIHVMELRIRELRKQLSAAVWVTPEEERRISSVAHDLAEHLYTRADKLRAIINAARNFKYDPSREQQCYFLFSDIVTAILGLEDHSLRARERETLNIASDAYGRLDLSALLDLHDSVQQFLALARRERLDIHEEEEWRNKKLELLENFPVRRAQSLEDSDRIAQQMKSLKARIAKSQNRLEVLAMVYLAAIKISRLRN